MHAELISQETLQTHARELYATHYRAMAPVLFEMISCQPIAGVLVAGLLNGSVHEFERVSQALIVLRSALGVTPAGHA